MGFGGWLKDFAFDSAATGIAAPLGPLAPIVGPWASNKIQEKPFANPLLAGPLSIPAAASNLIEHGSINAPEKAPDTVPGTDQIHPAPLNPTQFSSVSGNTSGYERP